MISQNLQNELKEIIHTEYGLMLSLKEIEELANGLVNFFEILMKIANKDKKEEQ